VLLVGAEGAGLTDAALAAADDRVTIQMAAPVDSLNVTVAAGIALHALVMAI
jgi:tRNA G18 (ribose-2'-O)-methylase SpoU